MTPEEFERLVDQREGETIEFKREMPGSSDLARLVTAFYNTRGGVILFGVEDKTRQLVGVRNPQGIEEGVINVLRARCSLDVMPTVEFVSYQGKEFVVVRCPQGAHKPYLMSGETLQPSVSDRATVWLRMRRCGGCMLRVVKVALKHYPAARQASRICRRS